ncbi:hypothetical protein [Tomitella biformata]|uniref:hypothetical protein n=1 Tax=Tomitella biformata TaxID=630403 RepID=UPI001F2834B6|nr:hypothetical protein [Tomitella biformata]
MAVGASTAALAVAAHGSGGGGLPSATDVVLLLATATVVGAAVAETSWLRRGRLPLFAALLSGQAIGHLVLATSSSGHSLDHAAALTAPMLLAHLAAAAGGAVLIELVERLYGPLTTVIRAAVAPTSPQPLSALRRVLPRRDAARPRDRVVALHSISRRGPPVPA